MYWHNYRYERQVWYRIGQDPDRRISRLMLGRFFGSLYSQQANREKYSVHQVLTLTYHSCLILGLSHRFIFRIFPVGVIVTPPESTDRYTYVLERFYYRFFQGMIDSEPYLMTPKVYAIYKAIGEKYNWDYTPVDD